MEAADLLAGADGARLAGLHGDGVALEPGHLAAVGINQLDVIGEAVGTGVVVPDLALGMDDGLVVLDVYVGGIDIRPCRSKVRVKGQCLVELVGDVKPHVLGQSAVVGVEVAVVPLVAAVERAVAVFP